MKNRYPGKCACGTWVDAQEGAAFKAGAKWAVRCDPCDRQGEPPAREMVGCVYWPNGEGFTECSAEYERAIDDKLSAESALDALGGYGLSLERGPLPEGYSDAYEAYCRADAKVQGLLGDGGHLGERIRYDQPDPMSALLGGGKVAWAPGGTHFVVAQDAR